jgi:hypothetical protein
MLRSFIVCSFVILFSLNSADGQNYLMPKGNSGFHGSAQLTDQDEFRVGKANIN